VLQLARGTAASARAVRLKIHGPSVSGCNASTVPTFGRESQGFGTDGDERCGLAQRQPTFALTQFSRVSWDFMMRAQSGHLLTRPSIAVACN